MSFVVITTERLELVLQTPEETLAFVEAMPPEDRAEISPDWIARVKQTKAGDPWSLGYTVIERESKASVGGCAFKGPPVDGMVEIAYGIDEPHRCKGYATEAANGLGLSNAARSWTPRMGWCAGGRGCVRQGADAPGDQTSSNSSLRLLSRPCSSLCRGSRVERTAFWLSQ
jgi:hypothetical protein